MPSLVEQNRGGAVAVGLAERGGAAIEGERVGRLPAQSVVGELAEVERGDRRAAVGRRLQKLIGARDILRQHLAFRQRDRDINRPVGAAASGRFFI